MYTIYSSLPLSPYMTCEQDGLVDGQGDGVCGCGLKPFNVCGLTSGRVRVMVLVGIGRELSRIVVWVHTCHDFGGVTASNNVGCFRLIMGGPKHVSLVGMMACSRLLPPILNVMIITTNPRGWHAAQMELLKPGLRVNTPTFPSRTLKPPTRHVNHDFTYPNFLHRTLPSSLSLS